MPIETDFPGMALEDAATIAQSIQFFQTDYEIVVNRIIAARGRKVVLGSKPRVCRFSGRTEPNVSFRKEAHAVPELAGNRTLVSLYECDDCNSRFSGFEDDLAKMTLLERGAGQVLGKKGVPSAKTGKKKSRIDMGLTGFDIQEHAGGPIAKIDNENQTLTITIAPQSYRPLGAYKALVKVALTLMPERDLANVPEALRWLQARDLTTDQIDDGTRYTCIRSWTPGPAPIARARAFLLRRRRSDIPGPAFIFVLAFGNLSFQIVVPASQLDKHLIGKTISLRSVPIFPFLDQGRVRGPTRYWTKDLSSSAQEKGSARAVFHFDSMTELRPPVIRIEQIGSPIRRHYKQRLTLIGLGLNRIGRVTEVPDTPATWGMIAKVRHLIRFVDEREIEEHRLVRPQPIDEEADRELMLARIFKPRY
jgi:ribosomal protein L30